ncbi:hypothetical protein DNTS_025583 [Danionella cerebrum]|uniref:Uncharacterized protein n=1 Tax=Danionella cerebrum TaxID=2873325 RepID=A0A553PYR3_9TELE|nr:hypothetical protein DNTS_025583 [Danionella translucida]
MKELKEVSRVCFTTSFLWPLLTHRLKVRMSLCVGLDHTEEGSCILCLQAETELPSPTSPYKALIVSAQTSVKELSLCVPSAHPQSKRICLRVGRPALFADRIMSESIALKDSPTYENLSINWSIVLKLPSTEFGDQCSSRPKTVAKSVPLPPRRLSLLFHLAQIPQIRRKGCAVENVPVRLEAALIDRVHVEAEDFHDVKLFRPVNKKYTFNCGTAGNSSRFLGLCGASLGPCRTLALRKRRDQSVCAVDPGRPGMERLRAKTSNTDTPERRWVEIGVLQTMHRREARVIAKPRLWRGNLSRFVMLMKPDISARSKRRAGSNSSALRLRRSEQQIPAREHSSPAQL